MGKKNGACTTPHFSPWFNCTSMDERTPRLCFPLFFPSSLSLLPPHFLPQLKRKPEWASSAPPVFKHLTRSLVSSFLQLIQEADKYC